jgi:hypothetical protein
MIGGALVILSYLIKRLSTTSGAELRAQLSGRGGHPRWRPSRDDLDELLEYALERLGEQLDATNGVLLLLEGGEWKGWAGFGLGVDARQVAARQADVPLAAQALRADAALSRDFTNGDPSPLAPLAAHARLTRARHSMRSLEREVGVPTTTGRRRASTAANRSPSPRPRPPRRRHRGQRAPHGRAQRGDATSTGARLEPRLSQSIDMAEVLEAVVKRLVGVLDMHACDIFEVDVDAAMRNRDLRDGALTP